MADRTLTVTLVGDADQLNRTFRGVSEEAGKFGDSLRRVGEIATGFIAANVIQSGLSGVKDFIGGSTAAASDLEQSIGGVQSVFGAAAEEILAWGATADQAAGLSKNAFNQIAAPIGAMLKNAGFGMDEVTSRTLDLTEKGADLAATFGGPVEDAMAAISSLMRGESNPIERYGVAIKQSDVNAKALATTGKSLTSELTAQELAVARLDLLFEQTTDSVGQFGRESDTAAGQAERQKAAQENLAAELGTQLLPIQVKVTQAKLAMVQAISEHVIPALAKFAEWVGTHVVPHLQAAAAFIAEHLVPVLQVLGEWVVDHVVPAFQQLAERAVAEMGKLKGYWESDLKPAVENIRTVVETVVGAIVAFVGEHWPQIQRVIEPVLDEIVNRVQTVMEVIKGIIGVAVDIIGGDWAGAWNGIKDIVKTVLRSVEESLNNILRFIGNLALLVFDAAKDLGGKIVDGIADGIRAGAGKVGEALSNIPGAGIVTGAVGAAGAVFGAIPGRAIGGPVTAGRPYWVGEQGRPELFVPSQSGTIVPESAVPRGGGGGGGFGNTYHITVLDSDALVRTLVDLERSGRIATVTVGGA